MRTPKNWSRVSLRHPKYGTGRPLEIWLRCQIYGLALGALRLLGAGWARISNRGMPSWAALLLNKMKQCCAGFTTNVQIVEKNSWFTKLAANKYIINTFCFQSCIVKRKACTTLTLPRDFQGSDRPNGERKGWTRYYSRIKGSVEQLSFIVYHQTS